MENIFTYDEIEDGCEPEYYEEDDFSDKELDALCDEEDC
jgi:hypothetical protein